MPDIAVTSRATEKRAYYKPLIGLIGLLYLLHYIALARQHIGSSTCSLVQLDSFTKAECRIFVLDPLVHLGLESRCNLSDPTYWPYAQPGLRTQGVNMLRPWENQYGVDYWIARAIELSSCRTEDMNEANLVYVNLHCHNSWFYGMEYHTNKSVEGPERELRAILRALSSHQRWLRTSGRDFALPVFHPAWDRRLFEIALNLSSFSPLIITSESRMLQPLQNKLGTQLRLVVPYVAVNDISPAAKNRGIFLYFKGGCAKKVGDQFRRRYSSSSGKMLRWHFIDAYTHPSLPDVRVECSNSKGGDTSTANPHEELMQELTRSMFCVVIAGDTQSTRRLSEVVLQGCIPVFIGLPFTTLPFARDIDYAGMGVFLSIKEQPWRPQDGPDNPYSKKLSTLGRWTMDWDSSKLGVIELPTLRDIYPYLKALSPSVVHSKQACVVREQPKFLWAPPSRRRSSVLGSLVVERLCDYGRMLDALAVDSL